MKMSKCRSRLRDLHEDGPRASEARSLLHPRVESSRIVNEIFPYGDGAAGEILTLAEYVEKDRRWVLGNLRHKYAFRLGCGSERRLQGHLGLNVNGSDPKSSDQPQ